MFYYSHLLIHSSGEGAHSTAHVQRSQDNLQDSGTWFPFYHVGPEERRFSDSLANTSTSWATSLGWKLFFVKWNHLKKKWVLPNKVIWNKTGMTGDFAFISTNNRKSNVGIRCGASPGCTGRGDGISLQTRWSPSFHSLRSSPMGRGDFIGRGHPRCSYGWWTSVPLMNYRWAWTDVKKWGIHSFHAWLTIDAQGCLDKEI